MAVTHKVALVKEMSNSQILLPDPVSKIATAVEQIKDWKVAHERVAHLCTLGGETEFELAGLLDRILREKWFEPHSSFKELCNARFKMGERKARYLAHAYDWVMKADLSGEYFATLGWSKIRLLTKVDPSLGLVWAEKAKELTYLQLEAELSETKKVASLASNDDTTTTLIFKPHPDQLGVIMAALEKANADDQSPYKTVALGSLCEEYLSGTMGLLKAKQIPRSEVVVWLKNLGPEETAKLCNEVFPDHEWEVSPLSDPA